MKERESKENCPVGKKEDISRKEEWKSKNTVHESFNHFIVNDYLRVLNVDIPKLLMLSSKPKYPVNFKFSTQISTIMFGWLLNFMV